MRRRTRGTSLVKKIEPSYPREAHRNRESGVSIFEGIISTGGCIGELRLLQAPP